MNIELAMKPMIEEARKTNKWLYCPYQSIWFSPDELVACQTAGQFRWGPVNWILRDPEEEVENLKNKVKEAKENLSRFMIRVGTTGLPVRQEAKAK